MHIQFKDVGLCLNNTPILSDISCELPSGSFVAIIGENGAGKSSLLNCFNTYLHTFSGDIYVDGMSLKNMNRKTIAQNIGAVLQDTPADLGLCVADIVMMGRYPHLKPFQSPNHVDRAFVKTALGKVNLTGYENAPFAHLSGGQKQRVQIARALTQTPHILLLDEPTNHLDIRQQIQILKLVKSMHITVIASLHDLNITASYADYIICLNKGKMVYQGIPQQVLTPKNIYTLFGVETMVHIPHKNTTPHVTISYT